MSTTFWTTLAESFSGSVTNGLSNSNTAQDTTGGHVTLQEAQAAAKQAEMLEEKNTEKYRGFGVRTVSSDYNDYYKDSGMTSGGGNENDRVWWCEYQQQADARHNKKESLSNQFHEQANESIKDAILSLPDETAFGAHGAVAIVNHVGEKAMGIAQLYDDATLERGKVDPVTGKLVSELRGNDNHNEVSSSDENKGGCNVQ
jgi:hypothetical protein